MIALALVAVAVLYVFARLVAATLGESDGQHNGGTGTVLVGLCGCAALIYYLI